MSEPYGPAPIGPATVSTRQRVSEETQALVRRVFDAGFYQDQLTAAGSGVIAAWEGLFEGERGSPDAATLLRHFLQSGWRLGLSPARWFDPLGYLAQHPDAAGVNPFLHYLEQTHAAALVEGDSGKRAMPAFRDRALRPAGFNRFGRAEYGPVARVFSYHGPAAEAADRPKHRPGELKLGGRLVVQLHLFHGDAAEQMIGWLSHLPADLLAGSAGEFDLLISVPQAEYGGDGRALRALEQYFAAALPLVRRVVARALPNRGRDVAPWVVGFRDHLVLLAPQDLVLHLHSKKSSHGSYHAGWMTYLGHCLLGSEAVARQMLACFAQDPALGLLAPAYWPQLRRAPHYGRSWGLADDLSRRMGFGPADPICPDFPAGSFFCARAAVLRPFLDLGLSYQDFPQEQGQICGTPAHAIERLLGAVPTHLGLRFDMVTVDLPPAEAAQLPRRLPGDSAPHAGTGLVGGGHARARQFGAGPGISLLSVVPCCAREPKRITAALRLCLAQGAEEVLLAFAQPTSWQPELSAAFATEIATGRLRLLSPPHHRLDVGTTEAGAEAKAWRRAQQAATRDIVVYLPFGGGVSPMSDGGASALWSPEFLPRLRRAFASHPEANCLAAGPLGSGGYGRDDFLMQPRDLMGALLGFAHRRQLLARGIWLDPELGAGAGWDFLLRATAEAAPMVPELPWVMSLTGLPWGGAASGGRPASASIGYLPDDVIRRVQVRHRNERLVRQQDALQIALKVPAPRPLYKHRWGDLHLAESLARALERRGCRARVDILPDWYQHQPEDDATLVLRGVTAYEPDPCHINMMWHISHPDRVSLDEMGGYDHVFVSAYGRGQQVIEALGMKASVMLQCSDSERFHPDVDLTGVPRHEVLFVGNSRKTRRWMPETCVARGLPLAIYGAEWQGLIAPRYIYGSHVPNGRLPAYYRAARIVLNDHWPHMAAEGFVSNRIMDVGMAGGLVISDHFEGAEIFMGHLITCKSPQEVEEALRHYLNDEADRQAKARALQDLVWLHHQVESRADQVLETLTGLVHDRRSQLRAEGPCRR